MKIDQFWRNIYQKQEIQLWGGNPIKVLIDINQLIIKFRLYSSKTGQAATYGTILFDFGLVHKIWQSYLRFQKVWTEAKKMII